jgi:hypothetical protein
MKQKTKSFRDSFEAEARKTWYEYVRTHILPPNMSRHPDKAYKNKGWKGWIHFLGWNIPNNPEDN